MGKVVNLPCVTTLDLSVERVADAIPKDMDGIVVIGWNADGSEYFASTYADGGTVLWLLERARLKLLRVPDDV